MKKYINKLLQTSIIFLVIFSLFSFLFSLPIDAATGINKQINFQGKLVNGAGAASPDTNVANATYTVIFSLYSASSGGVAIWTETDSVTTTNLDGTFQVALGVNTTFPGSVDFNTDNLYLGIKVNSDAEMTPRIRFTAVPYAFNADKIHGLTVTDTTGSLTIANGKTLTANSSIILAGTDSKTLTLNDSTTIGTNAITFAGGASEILTLAANKGVTFADAFTTSGANPITLTTSGTTTLTLPTTGTLLTNTASANQTITSTQTTGTVWGITDSTNLSAAIVGDAITLSGTGAFDQTGLQFNLSGATGTNLNDIVGSGSTWKVSRAGALTVASCTGCGGGGAVAWSAITAPTANLALNHAEFTTAFTWDTAATSAVFDATSLALTNDAVVDGGAQRLLVLNNNDDGILTTGLTEALLVLDNKDTNEAVTDGIKLVNSGGGGFTNYINAPNFNINNAGNITVAAGQGLDTAASGILAIGNTTATTVNIGNTAATIIAIGDLGAVTRAIKIGTGTGADTISIGTGATTADDINLGGLSTTTVDILGTLRAGDGGATNYIQITSAGNLSFVGSASTIDKVSGTLNLNTGNNQAISTGTGLFTTAGAHTSTGLITANGGLTTTGAVNLVGTSGAITLSGLTASSITTTGGADLNFTTGHFNTTSTGINNTAIGATTASTGAFTTLTSSGATTLGTGTSLTNTFGSGASSINTIGSITTPGALNLHGATSLDNTFAQTISSATAFQIQNSSSAPIFKVDTSTNNTNNLVTNPSIESAISGNWVLKGSATVTQDATDAYYGSNSLKITTTAAAGDGAKQNVTLANATVYTMSFYARSSAGNMSTFEIGRSEDGSTDISCLTAQTVLRNGWTRYACTFLTGTVSGTPYIYAKQTDATARSFINIDAVILQTEANYTPQYREGQIALQGTITTPLLLQNSTNSNTAFQVMTSKGASVFAVDTTDSNILAGNAGFEINSTGWTYSGTPGSILKDGSQAYIGTNSLKVTTTANANNGAKYTLANGTPFSPNLATSTQYALSWYAKLDAASAAFTDIVAGYSPDGGAETACTPSSQTVVTGGWTRYTCALTTPATATNSSAYIIVKQTGATAHTFYLDAVQLELGTTSTGYGAGNLNWSATIASPVNIRQNSNSTTAFQIETTNGTDLFSVDTLNSKVGIGSVAGAAFLDLGAATTTKAQLNLTSSAGTNVSSPGNGDLWWNGTNLNFYNGTITKDLLAGGGGGSLSTLTAATSTNTLANANFAQVWNWGTLTTQRGLTLSGGPAMTTGGVLDVNTVSKYVHTTAETGSLVNFGLADESTISSGTSISNVLSINPTVNVTTGAGAKQINGINLAPVFTACSTGTCQWAGLNVAGITAGANFTEIGVNIGAITGGAGTETGLSIGSGWDNAININSGALALNSNSITSTAGLTINAGGTGTLNLKAAGSTAGNTNNASIYFKDSSNATKGRVDTSSAATASQLAGNGRDGAISVTAAKNCSTTALATGRIDADCIATALSNTVSATATSLTVASTVGFAAGDEIMIAQMTGTGAGNYEFKHVATAVGTTITISEPGGLTNTYTNDATPSRPQVVRVPNYSEVNVSGAGSITITAWGGTTGGILAFRVQTSLINAGTIQANAAGLTGTAGAASGGTAGASGAAANAGGNGGTGNTGTTGNTPSGSGGATGGTGGIGGIGGAKSATVGAGGGGGGAGTGAGGGGGSYRTAGSSGSNGSGGAGGKGAPTGGAGGLGGSGSAGGTVGTGGSTYGTAALSTVFLGSGGAGGGSGGGSGGGAGGTGGTPNGAGGAGSIGGAGGAGGIGGGIVFIEAGTLNNTGGTISANGGTGVAASVGVIGSVGASAAPGAAATAAAGGGGGGSGAGGGGGGGSGGSVFIKTSSLTAPGTISSTGGTGANTATGGAGAAGGASAGTATATCNGGGGGGGGGGNAAGTAGAGGVASACTTNNSGGVGTAPTAATNPTGQTGGSGRIHCETPSGSGCTGADDQSVNTSSTGNSYGTLYIGAVNTFSADLAEYYTAGDSTIEDGDVVVIEDPQSSGSAVLMHTSTPYDKRIVGVVSTDPGLLLGSRDVEASQMSKQRKLALTGRVPVKVTTTNGSIHIGDYLTSSIHPGIAMKATKAGTVIGQALNNYSGDTVGIINVFVKASYYNGQSLEDLTAGLKTENGDIGKTVLNQFVQNKELAPVNSNFSEIVTDRIAAGLEIITPKVTTDTLQVNTIKSASDSANINVQLSDAGKFTIGEASKSAAITFDSQGNALFAGTITADKIKANQIEGLEIFVKSIKGITSTTSTTSADLALSQDLGKDTKEATSSSRDTRDTLDTRGTLAIDGLTINGSATVSGDLRVKGNGLVEGLLNVIDTVTTQNLIVSKVADFFSTVIFHKDVTFVGTPTFNKDTAGEVIISKDKDKIEVKFEREYQSAPIINATLVSETLTQDKFTQLKQDGTCDSSQDISVCQEKIDRLILDGNNQFIITKRSNRGFTILLNKKAGLDLQFSWNALLIDKNSVSAAAGLGGEVK